MLVVTRDVAAALLTAELQRSVAAGARVEYAIDTTAALTYGRRPNHVLHLLLTLLTFGLWIIVWALLTFGVHADVYASAHPHRPTMTERG